MNEPPCDHNVRCPKCGAWNIAIEAQAILTFLRSPEAVERLAKWLHVDGRDKTCGPDSTGCRFGHQRRAEAILAALAEDAK